MPGTQRRGPAHRRRAHRRVPPGALGGERPPRRGAAGDPVAGRDRHRPRGLGHLRQRGLARALPAGQRRDGHTLHSLHYGEGAYVETELEIQALLGVERDPVEPIRPEEAADALVGDPDPGPAGRLLRAVRGGWRVGRRRRRRHRDRQRRRRRDHRAGLLRRWSSTRATPRASSELVVGEGVTVHATCFTLGLAA